MKLRARMTLGLAVLLAGCAALGTAPEPPDVTVADLRPLESTLFEQRLEVDLRIRNPNPDPISIDGVDFTLEVNDRRLARGLGGESATIPAFGETLVTITATTTVVDMLRQVFALEGRETLDYRIDGKVYLEGFGRRSLAFERAGTLAPERPAPQ
jgi:LEA14-like dessication related protein